MKEESDQPKDDDSQGLPTLVALGVAGLAGAIYWVASQVVIGPALAWCYCLCLMALTYVRPTRTAFYVGLSAGLATFVPQTGFLWIIFGWPALCLWLVLAFWIGSFVALASYVRRSTGSHSGWWLIPLMWMGLEFFRSELYYLRFSWVSVGSLLAETNLSFLLPLVGVFGVGFLLMAGSGWLFGLTLKWRWIFGTVVFAGLIAVSLRPVSEADIAGESPVRVGGFQLEHPSFSELMNELDEFSAAEPEVDLIVLSEYSLENLPPAALLEWVRDQGKHLIIGGRLPIGDGEFYNTAFVIGPEGKIVFEQPKAVPVQFLNDGTPAEEQRVWQSPWGRIGLCICYDLSYTRVTDELIRQGAEWLIVPTMDDVHWGAAQHELHAKIAPIRAAEYGVPVFRLASSGITQLVSETGKVMASLPYPGKGERLAAALPPGGTGSLPPDRYGVWVGVFSALGVVLFGAVARLKSRFLKGKS